MARKSFPKIRLTDNEIDVLCKIADELKCNWFGIAGYEIDNSTGKIIHHRCKRLGWNSQTSDFNVCYDHGLKHYMSLQYGVRILNEAFEADTEVNSSMITKGELETYRKLLEKLNIESELNK